MRRFRPPDPAKQATPERMAQFLSDTALRTAWEWLYVRADPAAAAETLAEYGGDKTDPAYVELQAAITAAGGQP